MPTVRPMNNKRRERPVKVRWVESDSLTPGAGHGVDFFAGDPFTEDAVLIAVVRGFDWLHGNPKTVDVGIRKPGADFGPSFLEETRASIEEYLGNKSLVEL